MTAEGSATTGEDNTLHLSFTMNHRMALAVIEMPNTVKYKFTDERIPDYAVSPATTFSGIAQPLRVNDGTYRYLVNHATPAPTIEGHYDEGSKEFTITPSGLSTGSYKRYKVDGAVTTVKDYTMQRGDYLLADGNLLPKGTTLTEEQKASVAAIVFWTPAETNPEGRITPASLDFDKIMVKEHPNCTHGLAVSIKDAPGNVSWQNVNDWVADFQRGTDFNPVDKDEYVNIATGFDATGNINRILGYQNTKVLWAYNGYCKTNGKTDALVNPAEVLKTFIANNPAPANSTGWFLPSVKELHMLCYKDVDNIAYTRDNTETRDIVEVSISAVGGDALSPRNNHKRFWSSSESPSNKNGAFSVYFYNAFAQLSFATAEYGCAPPFTVTIPSFPTLTVIDCLSKSSPFGVFGVSFTVLTVTATFPVTPFRSVIVIIAEPSFTPVITIAFLSDFATAIFASLDFVVYGAVPLLTDTVTVLPTATSTLLGLIFKLGLSSSLSHDTNTKEVKQQITNAIDFKKGLVFIFDKFKLIDKMLMSTHK